ncbi:response regulator transcription factor [Nitrosomonas sp. Nm166]|uniref:response regulator transcription factor n=1 Tax=Nitrosomonas sp. Nm166 TaxID=1881054 RepID=UPI0011607123|nr:response regulator transcription factor [Nitrosomonas sp. Nm166]
MAMVEIDQDQHVALEKFLPQNETHVALITDIQSNYKNIERRLVSRDTVTAIDNAIARIKRLNPRILLVNANKPTDEYCDLLFTLRQQCPDTQAILIINEAVEENYLLKTLASGARGFITDSFDSLNFSKVIRAIDRGEAWISRQMIKKIMHYIVFASQYDSSEGDFDSSR